MSYLSARTFQKDFARPNYKTVGDALREQEEAAKKAAREEGSKQQVENMARRMLAMNKPLTEISEFNGLSEEQVKALTAEKA